MTKYHFAFSYFLHKTYFVEIPKTIVRAISIVAGQSSSLHRGMRIDSNQLLPNKRIYSMIYLIKQKTV